MIQDGTRTIAGYRALYAAGESPGDVLAALRERIEGWDDPGIFLHVISAEALDGFVAGLDPADRDRLPLWGVPFAVKDNIDVAGMPTTAGCPAFAYRPERHAETVARLVAAGAVPMGKTNLDQFATGLNGTRTPYPVPRNPRAPGRVPGGSSSGRRWRWRLGWCRWRWGRTRRGRGGCRRGYAGWWG